MSCSSADETLPSGEVSKGAIIFRHRCAECHSLKEVNVFNRLSVFSIDLRHRIYLILETVSLAIKPGYLFNIDF